MPKSQDIELDNSFETGTNFTLRGNTSCLNHMYEYVKTHGHSPRHHVNVRLGRTSPNKMYLIFLDKLTDKFGDHDFNIRRSQDVDIYEKVKDKNRHMEFGELIQIEGTGISVYAFRSGSRKNVSIEMFCATDEEYSELRTIAESFMELYVRDDDIFRDKFYMINHDGQALDLLEYDINREKFSGFDITKMYNDDFAEISAHIEETLSKTDGTTGIVLLHGVYGSGKTTYLRHLIATIKKRIIYMPPDMAAQLGTPSFFNFIRGYPNSILIIEDAEDILRTRDESANNPAISNILNMSDGIMGDALNIQVVCTFNANIEEIDSALTRKGRLIANYFFDELTPDKTKVLVQHAHGEAAVPTKERMTIAEVYTMNDKAMDNESGGKKKNRIGFLP